ncbi:MAG: hypothetical protein R2873_35290 [Caldilineaceae bacterium]
MTQPTPPTRATLLITADYPGYVVRGGLAEDSPPIPLMKVLRHFAPDIPATDEALLVSALTFEADPPSKRYLLQGQIDNVWSIPLGFDLPSGDEATFDLESLAFVVQYLTNNVGVFIRGDLALFDTRFTLTAARPPAADAAWAFTGNLADDETIPVAQVVTDLIVLATGEDLTVPDSLAGLNVHHIGFSVDTGTSKHYAFWGSLTWTIPAGDNKSLVVDAGVDVDSWLPDVAAGAPRPPRLYDLAVRGAVSFADFDDGDFFQNFRVEASYSHTNRTGGADDQITFTLHKDHLTLAAALSFGTGEDTKLTITFGDTTFGDILNFMVQLVDPDIEDFRFDPPWDMLSDISLSGLEIELNLTRKEAVVRYEINQDFGFVRIDFLGLRYLRNAAGKSTVNVEIVGRFLDQTYGEDDPLAWDALDDAPPATPGAGSAIFDLNYLGLGQHIALQNVADLTTVDAIMGALIHAIEEGDSVELLAFDVDSGWLIGAKFSVIGAVDLSVIFNDPVVYGLLIALKGDKVKALAGLRFEILYRKITNTRRLPPS